MPVALSFTEATLARRPTWSGRARKSVAMALSYDVRVNPFWVVAHAVERLQEAICQTAAAIHEVGGPLLEPRMRLPGR